MFSTLLRGRYIIAAGVIALTAWLLAFGGRVRYEQSLTAFFPADDPAVADYRRASEEFGNDNVVFITYDDAELLTPGGMDRLAELAEAVAPGRSPAVTGVQSLDKMPLFWAADDALVGIARAPTFARRLAERALSSGINSLSNADSPFSIGGAIRRADEDGLIDLRARVTSHPLLVGTLVTADGGATALVVQLEPMERQDPKRTIGALRAEADAFAARHDLERPALVGPPVLLADGFTAIEEDGRRLAVVGMGLIGLVTLSATGSPWWALVPLLAGWVVWRAAEAVLAGFGVKLSLSGGPLVAQIIVLTMPAASHLAFHFRDALRAGLDRRRAGRETLAAVATPVFWTAVAGAVGYGALLSSRVVPVFQFGAVLAACTMAASVLTFALSPIAMLPPFRLEWPIRAGSGSRVASAAAGLVRWVSHHSAAIVLGTLAVVVPVGFGLLRLDYESNYINAFKPKTRVVEDYHFTEERLGGIGVVSLVLPAGDTLDMPTIEAHRVLGDRVRTLEFDDEPAVSQVVSLATVLDPEGKLATLDPEGASYALGLKLDLIGRSPQGALLSNFWSPPGPDDPDGGWARLVIRVPESQPALEKERTFLAALAAARTLPSTRADGREPYVTGLSYLLTQTTRGVIDSSWTTLIWSAIGIATTLTVAFRSLRLAALAMLPTSMALILVLGLTGWSGLKLDLATALVASVALGLSVDDTFHCLLHYRRLRRDRPFEDALMESYQVSGPGVILSSLAVGLGFAVLRFSEFLPFSNFGTLVGVATLGSSLGNLVLLPACLALGHRVVSTRGRTTVGVTRGGDELGDSGDPVAIR